MLKFQLNIYLLHNVVMHFKGIVNNVFSSVICSSKVFTKNFFLLEFIQY